MPIVIGLGTSDDTSAWWPPLDLSGGKAPGISADAILVELRNCVGIGEAINLFEIGPALIARDYSQDEIMFGLNVLEHRKQIEFAPGNRVRPLK